MCMFSHLPALSRTYSVREESTRFSTLYPQDHAHNTITLPFHSITFGDKRKQKERKQSPSTPGVKDLDAALLHAIL